MLGRALPGELATASPDELGWFPNWVVGRLVGIPLFSLGRVLRTWPGEKFLARIALYVVCRTRLPSYLWTLYTSEGEPDYTPGKADDPTRRERASITATYNALDALKAANGDVPLELYRTVCKRLGELQDSNSGFWGTTHRSLEGGVETIGGIPRHTAMAIATVCEFGNPREYDGKRLQAAVRWLIRTCMLKLGGWSYTNTAGRRRTLGSLTTAAVVRALHEYRGMLQSGNVVSVGTVRSRVTLEEIDNAILRGLSALLKAQEDGLWCCQNDASQLANQFRDGLSILRWISPVGLSHADFREAARDAAVAFLNACEDAGYDRSLDPAAHPVALYLGCLDIARTYGIPRTDTLTPAVIQSVRGAFCSGQLSHWDWQRCCIGLHAETGRPKAKIHDRAVMLEVDVMRFGERCVAAICRSVVRKSILFKQMNPLIAKGIILFLIWETFVFILGLISDGNDWKKSFSVQEISRIIN